MRETVLGVSTMFVVDCGMNEVELMTRAEQPCTTVEG
jgi:hypothetical protein